jgi:hypothetical protein
VAQPTRSLFTHPTLSPATMARVLTAVVVLLTLASVAGQLARFFLGYDEGSTLIWLFDLDQEWNVPSIYQSATLLLCAFLLARIAAAQRALGGNHPAHWWGLSLIFVFLSIDELTSIHERAGPPLRASFPSAATGFLYHAWVVPAGVLLVVFGLTYWRFLADLPTRTRILFVVAGCIYVSGAMGMEMVGGVIETRYGEATLLYAAEATLEELMEMTGIVLFIYALMTESGNVTQSPNHSIGALTSPPTPKTEEAISDQ